MRNVHWETESMRLDRYDKLLLSESGITVGKPSYKQIFDCFECGIIFNTEGQYKEHNEKVHLVGVTGPALELNEHKKIDNDIFMVNSKQEQEKSVEEIDDATYILDYLPENAIEDKKMYTKIHDDSEEFAKALKKIESLIRKDSVYNFEGFEVKVEEDLRAGKPAKIEVNTENIKGLASIRFYVSKKKGTSVVVNRITREEFAVAKVLTLRFVKPLIDFILNSTEENVNEVFDHLVKHANNKTIGKINPIKKQYCCEDCGYVAKNDHGIKIHIAKMHSEKVVNKVTLCCALCQLVLQDQAAIENHMSVDHKSKAPGVEKYGCQDCNEVFQDNDLLTAHIITHRKLNIEKTPGVKFRCEYCDFTSSVTKQIKQHMEEEHNSELTRSSQIPLLLSNAMCNPGLDNKNTLGKRKITENVNTVKCETCGHMVQDERELRLHIANQHITDKDVIVGTKRDDSFMLRSESYSPKRKQRIVSISSDKKKTHEETSPTLSVNKERQFHNTNPVEETIHGYEPSTNQDQIKVLETKDEIKQLNDPNLIELPETVKQLVSEGSKEAGSTGNGTCLIGTTSMHITGDLASTEVIARQLNTHIANYRQVYIKKLKQIFL